MENKPVSMLVISTHAFVERHLGNISHKETAGTGEKAVGGEGKEWNFKAGRNEGILKGLVNCLLRRVLLYFLGWTTA